MPNQKVVFTYGGSSGPVFSTDGTAAGTTQVGTVSTRAIGSLGLGTAFYAGGYDSTLGGAPVFVTDGSSAGTIRVGIVPFFTNPTDYTLLSPGRLVFNVGGDLWTTTGDFGTTTLVKAGATDPNFASGLAALGNGRAVFYGTDGFINVTDGTAAGTVSLGISDGGTNGQATVREFTPIGNGRALFQGTGPNGKQPWITDGTAAGTSELKNLGSGGSNPAQFTPVGGGKFVFSATTSSGYELWVTDGTAAGTVLVKDINPGLANSNPLKLTALGNGLVVFGADNGTTGIEPWVTDGTAAGTKLIKNLDSGSGSSLFAPIKGTSGYGFTSLGDGRAVFAASVSGIGVWITDGTSAGTTLLRLVNTPGGNGFGSVDSFASAGPGKVIFTMNDGVSGTQPWITDGTTAGTVLLASSSSLPNNYTVLGNAGTVLVGGLLTVAPTLTGGNVQFENAGSTLRAPNLTGAVTVNGFQAGNSIDLTNTTGATIATGAGGTVVTTSGGTLNLGTAPAGSTYKLYGDGHGGQQVLLDGPAPATAIRYTNAATNVSGTDTGTAYTGPVDYLQRQYIWGGTDAVAIAASTPNTFLKGGAAGDALLVSSGNNVLDGAGGSNFLIGGTGADGGADTFFVDGRGGVETWSTIVNFHQGDQATIFGFHAGTSTRPYTADDGAVGYKGLTIHSELNGVGTGIQASMTFTGLDQATADAHFSITTGTLLPGTAGAIDYLLIQYNR